jgi:transposase
MRQASKCIPESAEKTVRDIRRATRRHHSAEEKIRIVLEGLRGEDSIAELCRKEGINQNLYYRWSKEFLEAGKNGSPATRRVRRPQTRSRSSRLRRASSRRQPIT